MYHHHIKDMTDALWDATNRAGRPLAEEEIKGVLMDYWNDKIAITWSTADVIGRAEERGISLDEEQARSVLRTALHRHDCTIGLTWDVLDIYIDEEGNEG